MGDRLNFTDGTQIRDTLEVLGVLLELIFSAIFREKKENISESTYNVPNASAVYFSSFYFTLFGAESVL